MGLTALPDVEFCSTDSETIEQSIIKVYEGLSGKTLYPGDPVRLFLEALAAVIIQQRNLIDYTGKQNLLKYATGAHLDNLGALTNTARLDPAPALTTIRFSLDVPLLHVVAIPAGSRVSPDGQLIFETISFAEIDAGSIFVDVAAQCQTAGEVGNNWLPGQVAKIVDPVSSVVLVENTTTTTGGADVEDDDRYRARIQLAPESFSVAGPTLAYAHWTKTAHQDIADVAVYRDSGLDTLDRAGLNSILGVFGILDTSGLTDDQARIAVGQKVTASIVNICPLLKDGGIPDQIIIDLVDEKINDRAIRPLTDQVVIGAPGVINFDITLTFFILESDRLAVADIQTRVVAAVDDFAEWQKEKLGRDVNPDKLIAMIVDAGAYRADITTPTLTTVDQNQVAIAQVITANYGGLVSG